jgi:hypothetical protein
LLRIFFNNLKRIKGEGLRAAAYVIEGGIRFLKIRKELSYTPVTPEIQKLFIEKFKSTHSIFERSTEAQDL